jgi:hypothetical protein
MAGPDTRHRSLICVASALRRLAVAVLAGVLMVPGGPASASLEESYRTRDGVAAYLGVLPAQAVRGHPPGHPERRMHGGPPSGPHDYHLVVALFDTATGARIGDAQVTAAVSGLGHVGKTRRRLDPMTIADAVTYGGYVTLPGRDRYVIEIEVVRAGQASPVQLEFVYHHGAP